MTADGVKVLFDLQSALKKNEALFSDDKNLIIEVEDIKTISVAKRSSDTDGFTFPISKDLSPGDRVTITGRVAGKSPIGGWCFELLLCSVGGECKAIQQFFPGRDRMYALSYVMDKIGAEEIQLVTRTRVSGMKPSDFFVDGILITRALGNALVDTRSVVYIMENDRLLEELDGGGYSEYLFATGDPLYTIYDDNLNDGKKSIRISRRVNDWDGLDIRISLMNFLHTNRYVVRVTGRVDGNAPPDSEITLQLLPSYQWRGTKSVKDDQSFVLLHAFTPQELDATESIRITTNQTAKNMAFIITSIEVFVLD
ncbi:MAG: hypothetical protein FWB80_09060 [Defluviitaleaceae bacterium]|nr:hypothetical protein [Defluviitaleaceae bacterium]